jgi:hypothetical protein
METCDRVLSCDSCDSDVTILSKYRNHKGSAARFGVFPYSALNKPMNEETPNFKVTDRRLFNPDGTPRDVPPEEKPEPKLDAPPELASAPTPPPEAVAGAQSTQPQDVTTPAHEPADADEEELPDAENPAGFANFIMSIASNAASSLGMMEHPVTHKREVDLELAKHWIDILGMLERKTKGNLVPQEEKILESLLADLRMQYVSLTSSVSPKASGAYTGRDIIGG